MGIIQKVSPLPQKNNSSNNPFNLMPSSRFIPVSLVVLLCLAEVDTVSAQTNATPVTATIPHSDRLQELVNRAARQVLEKFAAKKLERNQLAITLVDLSDPQKPAQGS